MDSILTSIKSMLGIDSTITAFDDELIIFINGVFTTLTQLGIGKADFTITGSTETWADFTESKKTYELVKTYIYLKVRLVFDPPTSSSVIDVMNKQIAESEWRLRENAEEATVQTEYAEILAAQTSGDDSDG